MIKYSLTFQTDVIYTLLLATQIYMVHLYLYTIITFSNVNYTYNQYFLNSGGKEGFLSVLNIYMSLVSIHEQILKVLDNKI